MKYKLVEENEASEPLIPKEKNTDFKTISEQKIFLSVENIEKTEKELKTEINESLELNLIKSIYANRFGSTTNKILAHMKRRIINAWRK